MWDPRVHRAGSHPWCALVANPPEWLAEPLTGQVCGGYVQWLSLGAYGVVGECWACGHDHYLRRTDARLRPAWRRIDRALWFELRRTARALGETLWLGFEFGYAPRRRRRAKPPQQSYAQTCPHCHGVTKGASSICWLCAGSGYRLFAAEEQATRATRVFPPVAISGRPPQSAGFDLRYPPLSGFHTPTLDDVLEAEPRSQSSLRRAAPVDVVPVIAAFCVLASLGRVRNHREWWPWWQWLVEERRRTLGPSRPSSSCPVRAVAGVSPEPPPRNLPRAA